jgi:hypothetical protein
LTEQGREFLQQYRTFHERYVRAQKSLEALNCEREKMALMCQNSGSRVGYVRSVTDAEKIKASKLKI